MILSKMGKKKVVQKTGEEAIKGKTEAPLKVASEVKKGRGRIESGRIYINSSYNNTLVSVTDEKGNVLGWSSSGAMGFGGPKRSTPFAASKVVAAIAEKISKTGPVDVDIFVSGVGPGRDSALRSLVNFGFNILSIHDVTPMPHNGPRQKKVRRV